MPQTRKIEIETMEVILLLFPRRLAVRSKNGDDIEVKIIRYKKVKG